MTLCKDFVIFITTIFSLGITISTICLLSMDITVEKKFAYPYEPQIIVLVMISSYMLGNILCYVAYYFMNRIIILFQIMCIIFGILTIGSLFILLDEHDMKELYISFLSVSFLASIIFIITTNIAPKYEDSEIQPLEPNKLIQKEPISLKDFDLIIPNLSEYLGEQCSICMNSYETYENLRILECKHYFHKQCIEQWLQTRSTCPLCRGNTNDTIQINMTIN